MVRRIETFEVKIAILVLTDMLHVKRISNIEITLKSAKLHIVTIYSGYKNDRKDIQTIATWQ